MKSRQEFVTFCHLCIGRCSRRATVEDGKIIELERDTESGLFSEFCPTTKGRSIMEIGTHPLRLKYPQKRKGARGEGKWKRISWDEALDTIAEKLGDIKAKFGPEYVGMFLGEPKGMEFAFGQRFAAAFGTSSVATPAHICGGPLFAASHSTYGEHCVFDEKHTPRLIVSWGCNSINTNNGLHRESFRAALLNGAKLAVIDPKRIDIAKRADLWIKLRPGSDGALAMGVLKVIIEEKLYIEDFVARWTTGFDKLQEEIKKYRLEDVEKVTWVPQEQIKKLARLYAEFKPSFINWGNGLDQILNGFQTARALCILRAITGNLDVPGGEIYITPGTFTRPGRFYLVKKYPRKTENTPGSEFKWAMMSAYVPYQSLIKAILEEKPHPVKAGICILTDPIISYPDSMQTYRAFMKLDFSVVLEIFMTPTAALADIVLPVAHGIEHDTVGYWPPDLGELRAYPKLIDPPGESWSDMKIINELSKRLGLKEDFWDDENKALDYMLEPSGLTFQDFKQKRILLPSKDKYRRYEDGGFKTPSGKVEIYSARLEELGYSPLPRWEEVSRFRFEPSQEYPLLLTNDKEDAYYNTGYKHLAFLRKMSPEPITRLNPETARKAGLKDGDMVYIETKKGKIKQKLSLDRDLDPRVVYAGWGWWFPEEPADLFNWRKSNLNVLTDADPPYEPYVGSVELRGIPCRVYKA